MVEIRRLRQIMEAPIKNRRDFVNHSHSETSLTFGEVDLTGEFLAEITRKVDELIESRPDHHLAEGWKKAANAAWRAHRAWQKAWTEDRPDERQSRQG